MAELKEDLKKVLAETFNEEKPEKDEENPDEQDKGKLEDNGT